MCMTHIMTHSFVFALCESFSKLVSPVGIMGSVLLINSICRRYWAASLQSASETPKFYTCSVTEACLPPAKNGTALQSPTQCAPGYRYVLTFRVL
jgi:hypothetical protein